MQKPVVWPAFFLTKIIQIAHTIAAVLVFL